MISTSVSHTQPFRLLDTWSVVLCYASCLFRWLSYNLPSSVRHKNGILEAHVLFYSVRPALFNVYSDLHSSEMLRGVISEKSADLINIAAQAWSQACVLLMNTGWIVGLSPDVQCS
jgi:Trk-type K+ transport system membrane component